MNKRSWARLAVAVAVGVMAAAPGPLGAAERPPAHLLSEGTGTATGLFVTYQDRAFIIPGGTFPPPDIATPYSAGGIDLGGTAAAVGAMGYSPYVELFGAINSVSPPGSPAFPAEAVGQHSRASVNGQPPKRQDASMLPAQGAFAAGNATASIGDGPVAEALARGFHLTAPTGGVTVAEAATHMVVSKASGLTVAEAVTRLQDVVINNALRIESITLTAKTSADGGDGVAQATMTAHGATLGGTAVRITETGFELADQSVPANSGALTEHLGRAGIRLVAPGSRTVEPGGERSLAEASGPVLEIASPNGERLSVTLGRAVAVTTTQGAFDADASDSGVSGGGADIPASQGRAAARPAADRPRPGTR